MTIYTIEYNELTAKIRKKWLLKLEPFVYLAWFVDFLSLSLRCAKWKIIISRLKPQTAIALQCSFVVLHEFHLNNTKWNCFCYALLITNGRHKKTKYYLPLAQPHEIVETILGVVILILFPILFNRCKSALQAR